MAAAPPDAEDGTLVESDVEPVQERRRLEREDGDDEPFSGNPLLVFNLPAESDSEPDDELSEEQIAFILDNIDESQYISRR